MTDDSDGVVGRTVPFDHFQDVAIREIGPKRRFEVIPFDRVILPLSPAYLVHGVLPKTGLTVVWGPPKCGKSFWVFDLVMHVALGWKYRGCRTLQGSVIYAALEGKSGFRARILAWRTTKLNKDHDPVPFYFCPITLNLVADHAAFASELAMSGSGNPGAIVIDTLNRSLVGSESDDRDMAAYIAAAEFLAKRFDCLVIVVHHSGVDTSRPRGHTSLAGAVDTQISVRKDASGQTVATVDLAKDFETGTQFASRLQTVELGVDDLGEPITSCVIEPVERAEPTAPKGAPPRSTKINRPEAAIKAAFEEVLGLQAHQVRVLNDGPVVKAAKVSEVRAEFLRRYVVGDPDRKKASAAIRQAFKRALDGCQNVGLHTGSWAENEWIWRA